MKNLNVFSTLPTRRWWTMLLALLFAMSISAQTISVKGVVKDAKSGETIVGANVIVKGTTTGTVTDVDGNFSLNASSNAVLEVKYVGYKSQSIQIQGRKTLTILLSEDVAALEEVMVVGYATGSQKTISGAVQKVGRESMNAGVVRDPLAALSGKVAGVNIQKAGGDPTAATAIRVRGTTSLSGGNDPLVIIDGVFGDLGLLNALSPSDIESFTVLKDASETAQYGSRGASGVIVVTTVKGKMSGTQARKTSLSYDGTFGVESVFKNVNMMNADEYRSAIKDYGYANAVDAGSSTNWMKAMQRTGYTQNHKVSFGSGTADANYRASLGVVDQQGILKNSEMRNFTAKLDAQQLMFNNKLSLEMGMFGSKKHSRYVNDYHKTFYSAASFNPTAPSLQNGDGTWWEDTNASEVDNPLGRLSINDYEDNAYLTAHAKVSWDILDGLKLSALGSYTYNNKINSLYVPRTIRQGIREGNGLGQKASASNDNLMGNITLNYKKTINKHRFDILGLAEVQQYKSSGFKTTVRGFGTDYFGAENLSAGATLKWNKDEIYSYLNNYRLTSFMGRFNYVFDKRYIATVNVRTDGSSKLGVNNQWGFFPSGSLAWAANEESFIKNLKLFNDLKVRVGYGVTGNQDAIDPYNSLALMSPSGVTTVNGASTVTYSFNRNANPDLKWETKKMFDAGIDAAILDNRIKLTVDFYASKTTNLLYKYDVPVPPFVYPTLLANLGELENNGLEVSATFVPVKNKDMELTLSGNLAFQKNKLLSLSGKYMGQDLSAKQYMGLGGVSGAGSIGGNTNVIYEIVGQPLGVFYLPKCNGLINDGTGKYYYNILNLDSNPTVQTDDGKDRYVAGQAMPKVLMGSNISFRYKQFDIQTQLNGAFGHKIFNGTSLTYNNMNTFPTYNVLSGAAAKNIRESVVTDYWLEKGDYVNVAYINVGYNVNMKNIKWANSIRISASVNNVYTFTGYSGLSPMINSTTVGSNLGVDDKNFYPLSRTYSMGVSVNF